jgi:surface carbohydrate biosynthesis protein
MTIDVLNLQWHSTPARDREMATLVCNFLKLNEISVFEGCIFDGYHLIDTLKPSLLFITNSIGAEINVDIVRYAKSKGIHCISSSAEGNFKKESIVQFLWGHNKEQVLYEDKTFLWNKNALRYSLEERIDLTGRIGVCGGIGFDRYKILEDATSTKNENQEYDLTVLVSCWNFDFLNSKSDAYGKFNGKLLSDKDFNFFKEDLNKFNIELLATIEMLPRVKFILKMHPGCLGGKYYSGISGGDKYKNTEVLQYEKGISELIFQSDLVLSYESTTALEAWLCNKPTALLNPSGIDFPMREGFHLGQPNFITAEALSQAIIKLSGDGVLPSFSVFKEVRNTLIESIVGWQDGLNHVRISNEIICQLNLPKSQIKYSGSITKLYIRKLTLRFKWKYYPIIQRLLSRILPVYRVYEDWDQENLEAFAKLRMTKQLEFYRKCNLSMNDLSTLYAYKEI